MGNHIIHIIVAILFVFIVRKIWDSSADFITNIARAAFGAGILFMILFFAFKFMTEHWYIIAPIIGVVVYFVKGNKIETALGATALSTVILLIGGGIIPDHHVSQRNDRFDERQYEEYLEQQYQQELQRQREEQRQQELENERQEETARKMQEIREREKNSEVGKVLYGYYQAISEHQFQKAYDLMTTNAQNYQGTLEHFTNSRKDTVSVEVLDFNRLNIGDSKIEGAYLIRTQDKTSEGVKVQTFEGRVTFVKEGGRWLIDSQSSKRVDS